MLNSNTVHNNLHWINDTCAIQLSDCHLVGKTKSLNGRVSIYVQDAEGNPERIAVSTIFPESYDKVLDFIVLAVGEIEGIPPSNVMAAKITGLAADERDRVENEPKTQKRTPDDDENDIGISNDDEGRPTIVADPTQIRSVVDQLEQMLIENHEPFYQRDGALMTIKYAPRAPQHGLKEDVARHRIAIAKTKHIQEAATDLANWMVPSSFSQSKNTQYFKPGTCPENIVKHLEDRASSGLPVLAGITTTPTIRGDGSLITEPGYDEATGLYFAPSRSYPNQPTNPTLDDAVDAVRSLEDLFCDFPFAEDCHRASALAGILTIISRHLMRTVPMFSSTSHTAGSGKGLIVDVITTAAIGGAPALVANCDEEEMRKTLLTVAIDGDRVTAFDNVTGVFGSPTLDMAITAGTIKGRILGKSESAEVPIQTTFFVTGNAIRYRGDLTRRMIPITLSPIDQNPETRTDFKHKQLLQYVTKHHPSLLNHALTILRAYLLEGKPEQDLPPYGSFYEWSDLVRSSLVWAGCADPCKGREAVQAMADDAYEDLSDLLHTWEKCLPDGQKFTIKEILTIVGREYKEMIKGAPHNHDWLALGEALTDFDPASKGKIPDMSARRLGRRLPVNNGSSRVIDDLRLVQVFDKTAKTNKWGVISVNATAAVGNDGDADDADLTFQPEDWIFDN